MLCIKKTKEFLNESDDSVFTIMNLACKHGQSINNCFRCSDEVERNLTELNRSYHACSLGRTSSLLVVTVD